ncbi:hypothetical protein BH09MYX1_BH09MYX1_50810 [soil metagenome]
MKSAIVVGCTLIVACGGSVATPIGGDDSGTDVGTGVDTGISVDGGGTVKCPPTTPSTGQACAPEGLACEYGSSNILACNVVAHCENGAWAIPFPPGPGPNECGTKNPPACPSTFAGVPVGTSCSKDYPTHCNYPEGECACTVPSSGPFPADAAAVAKWICGTPTEPSCPSPRPKIGSPCAVSAKVRCDYGACVLIGGTVLKCDAGVWQEEMFGCPD